MRGDLRLASAVVVLLSLAACDVVYGPTSPTAGWVTRDSARYTLYVQPGSFAEANATAIIDVLEEQYAHAASVLGVGEGPPISIFLYNRGSDVNPPLPDARAGVAFPATNAVHAVAFAPLDDNLRALVAHEANHVIVQRALGRAGTSFMNEGLASALISERLGDMGRASLYRWARNNRARLVRLSELVDDERWNSNSNDGYQTSASFLAFLLERYGAASLKQWYYADSASIARRAQEIYGRSLDALEAEWLNEI